LHACSNHCSVKGQTPRQNKCRSAAIRNKQTHESRHRIEHNLRMKGKDAIPVPTVLATTKTDARKVEEVIVKAKTLDGTTKSGTKAAADHLATRTKIGTVTAARIPASRVRTGKMAAKVDGAENAANGTLALTVTAQTKQRLSRTNRASGRPAMQNNPNRRHRCRRLKNADHQPRSSQTARGDQSVTGPSWIEKVKTPINQLLNEKKLRHLQ
jgi:hypothetical protein